MQIKLDISGHSLLIIPKQINFYFSVLVLKEPVVLDASNPIGEFLFPKIVTKKLKVFIPVLYKYLCDKQR